MLHASERVQEQYVIDVNKGLLIRSCIVPVPIVPVHRYPVPSREPRQKEPFLDQDGGFPSRNICPLSFFFPRSSPAPPPPRLFRAGLLLLLPQYEWSHIVQEAVHRGDLTLVKQAVESGADPNHMDVSSTGPVLLLAMGAFVLIVGITHARRRTASRRSC
eukprot:COSAG01_NODE_1052_length_11920_cov_6.553760_9_plen_160_part_00